MHELALRMHSCAENVAGTRVVRYRYTLCLPGPIYTSHEDIPVRSKERRRHAQAINRFGNKAKFKNVPFLTHRPGMDKRYDGSLEAITTNETQACESAAKTRGNGAQFTGCAILTCTHIWGCLSTADVLYSC